MNNRVDGGFIEWAGTMKRATENGERWALVALVSTTYLQRDRRGETASYVLYIFRGKFDTLNLRLEYD